MTAAPLPAVVWLASFPKSGNTWMRVLLHNLLGGAEAPCDLDRLGDLGTMPSVVQDFTDACQLDPDLMTLDELETVRRRMHDWMAATPRRWCACKTHDGFTGASGRVMFGAGRVLYLLRDPRDVAVSLSHQVKAGLQGAVEYVCGDRAWSPGAGHVRYWMGGWRAHVRGWTGQTGLPLRVLRYEDLRADPAARLAALLPFLGIGADAAAVARAVAHCDLAELQRQEAEHGFAERSVGQQRFFRCGRVGEWREVLSPDQVRRIEDSCGEDMRRWGYRPDGGAMPFGRDAPGEAG